MLISFGVENYACFRDYQELSMRAAKRVEDKYAFDTGLKTVSRLHRVAAIYGPNGSGKSRFLDALLSAGNFVLKSADSSRAGSRSGAVPFRFDLGATMEPSAFTFEFAVGEDTFEYEFAVGLGRVWSETLHVRPAGANRRRWFDRALNPETAETSWQFGPSLKGPVEAWRDATRPDALLVSTAMLLNSETFRPLTDFFKGFEFAESWRRVPGFALGWATGVAADPETGDMIAGFLRDADIAVEKLRSRDIPADEVLRDISAIEGMAGFPEEVLKDLGVGEDAKIKLPGFGLPLEGTDGLAYVGLMEQSDGTKRMLELAPWWLAAASDSMLLVVDELDRSLHPHLVGFLLRYINRVGANKTQLIATLHDPTQLSSDVLHRDQVWLTEKDRRQRSTLSPLSDFKTRQKESLIRGYLGGRYGALPNVRELAYHE